MKYLSLLLLPIFAHAAGKIINADIAPSGTANIALNKLAASTANNVCTFDASGYIAGGVAPGTSGNVLSSNGTNWVSLANTAALSVGALDSQAPNATGLSLVSNVLSAQSATATSPGLVSTSAQTFAGAKTFTSAIQFPNGTGATPGIYTATGSGNTGIYFGANGTSFGYNSAEVASFAASVWKFNVPVQANFVGSANSPAFFLDSSPNSGFWQIGTNNWGWSAASAKVLDMSTAGLGVTGALTVSTTVTASNIVDSGLTASQAVVTDANKQLTSMAYSATGGTSNIVSRDANGNTFANNFTSAGVSVVSAGGTTTLSPNSTRRQILTGTQNQDFKLPAANTLNLNTQFDFNNNSTGTLLIKDNSNTTITTIPPGGAGFVYVTDIGSPSGVWDARFTLPFNSSWGTSGVTVAGNATVTGSVLIADRLNINTVTASRPLKSDGSKYVTSSQIILSSANDVSGTLDVGNGGLGISSTPSNGQIPIGNGTNYTAATITAGSNITITNGSGSIIVSSSAGGGGGGGAEVMYYGSNAAWSTGCGNNVWRYGSTGTAAGGSDITVTDSATLGTQFVASTAGLYDVSFNYGGQTGGSSTAIMINDPSCTTAFSSQTPSTTAGLLATCSASSTGIVGTCHAHPKLNAGDIITIKSNANGTTMTNDYRTIFHMIKVSN